MESTPKERTLQTTVVSSRRTWPTTTGWRSTAKKEGCPDCNTWLRSRCSGWVRPTRGAPNTDRRPSSYVLSLVNTLPASSECWDPCPTGPSLLKTLNVHQAQRWTRLRNAKCGRHFVCLVCETYKPLSFRPECLYTV